MTLRPTGRARRRRSPKMRCLRFAISVLAVPDGCSCAECRPVIAAHQQEQPVALPTYDELSVATVEDEPRAR